jgi:putative serine protease PepD
MLVVAALVGLVAGLLGGAVALVAGDRIRGTTSQSALPAPAPGVTTRPEGSIAQIAAKAVPSVVTIRIRSSDGSGTGSGFVIDNSGHILTNNHVIASVASSSGSITVDLSDGTTMGATIVGRDASYDLAVLKAERTDMTPLGFGRSADVVVGDGVIAVGAPLGLEATVTSGIVSAVDRPVAAGGGDQASYINAIQTDAAINPGNSGGPLLDLNGKVIGVNSAIARVPGSTSDTGGNIGVGFAIPSDQAYKTAQQLISTGKAVHPVIGVSLDPQYDGSGAKIRDNGGVVSGSPADAAGLQDGDVIVAFEGRRITSADQLVVAIRARSVGDTVRLTVERDGKEVDKSLTLQSGS